MACGIGKEDCGGDGKYYNPDYSAWYSGVYSGCTMCHYAHAQGQTILTNEQLATADQNIREWAAVGYTPMFAATIALGGLEVMAGSSSSIVTIGTMLCVDGDCTNEVTILGYSEDIEFYTGVNVNTLVNVANYTWEGTNIPFLDNAMARGDLIVFVSDFLRFPERTFPREVQYLISQGYIIDLFSLSH